MYRIGATLRPSRDLYRPNGNAHGRRPNVHNTPELESILSGCIERMYDTVGMSAPAIHQQWSYCHPKEHDSVTDVMYPEHMTSSIMSHRLWIIPEYRRGSRDRSQIRLGDKCRRRQRFRPEYFHFSRFCRLDSCRKVWINNNCYVWSSIIYYLVWCRFWTTINEMPGW